MITASHNPPEDNGVKLVDPMVGTALSRREPLANLTYRVRCSRYSHHLQYLKAVSRSEQGLRVLGKLMLQPLQTRPPMRLS